jgi:hypothetical protein
VKALLQGALAALHHHKTHAAVNGTLLTRSSARNSCSIGGHKARLRDLLIHNQLDQRSLSC